MIPKNCKRLAEVDFPIAVVSRHAAREKSGPKGYPSTLHQWWARRPLGSCRAILLSLLLPDPCHALCPVEFKLEAREYLRGVIGHPGPSDLELRDALLRFIGEFANWDNAANSSFLEVSRGLLRAAYADEVPLVVDPFAGGGSITLEALRLGCDAFATDLNPVACLILRTMLEDIPRSGINLAEELRRAGEEIKQAADMELGRYYPKTPVLPTDIRKTPLLLLNVQNGKAVSFVTVTDAFSYLCQNQTDYTHYVHITEAQAHAPTAMQLGFSRTGAASRNDQAWLVEIGAKLLNLKWDRPIAYLWARTIRCEAPNCGMEIPLVRTFWLSKKAGRKTALRYKPERTKDGPPTLNLEIFSPAKDAEVPRGTISRAKATCPHCGTTHAPERVRVQLADQHGGADAIFDSAGERAGGARLLAVVTIKLGESGRSYRLPTKYDYAAVRNAHASVAKLEWDRNGKIREQIAEWTLRRGSSARLYPASLIWCLRKSGRDLADRVETWLAWQRVQRDLAEGVLGHDIEAEERQEVQAHAKEAGNAAKDAVWADYRFIVFTDNEEPDRLRAIDLGAGHSSSNETISGRVLAALKGQGLLNVDVGVGYIQRKWPPALVESGAWPLSGLRQSFLDGSLTRLPDPDKVLRRKIVEFVESGDFGMASGLLPNGRYQRVWFKQTLHPEEVAFDANVFLLKKETAEKLTAPAVPVVTPPEDKKETQSEEKQDDRGKTGPSLPRVVVIRLSGEVPPEQWNKVGIKLIPKLRSTNELHIEVVMSANVDGKSAANFVEEVNQAISDLGLQAKLNVNYQ